MDPICTFLFSILVVATTIAIIKDTLLVLMEGRPKGIDFNDVMNVLSNIPGVKRVHNLRIWALTLDKLALSAHLAICGLIFFIYLFVKYCKDVFILWFAFADSDVNPQMILVEATKNIHDKYNFFEMTLQIEEFQETMEDCTQCKNPAA